MSGKGGDREEERVWRQLRCCPVSGVEVMGLWRDPT